MNVVLAVMAGTPSPCGSLEWHKAALTTECTKPPPFLANRVLLLLLLLTVTVLICVTTPAF